MTDASGGKLWTLDSITKVNHALQSAATLAAQPRLHAVAYRDVRARGTRGQRNCRQRTCGRISSGRPVVRFGSKPGQSPSAGRWSCGSSSPRRVTPTNSGSS